MERKQVLLKINSIKTRIETHLKENRKMAIEEIENKFYQNKD